MKTLKFALIAAIVSCTMISFANAGNFDILPQPVKVVYISLDKALHNAGLVQAMYAQINKDDILKSPSLVFIADVKYNGVLYRISGTLDEWIRFFNMQGEVPTFSTVPILSKEN